MECWSLCIWSLTNLTIVIIALVGLFARNNFGRAGYESAEYKVVTSDGKFEVREYPDLMLVATTTKNGCSRS